jgi:O-antigen/teichoic acid export membrane protein
MSLSRVIRGSLWLYISSIASNFLGYIYWLLAARFVDASTVGTGAAVVGVSSLITGLLSLGLSSGATRMIGRSAGIKDEGGVGAYFITALGISLLVSTVASLLILLYPGGFMGLTKSEASFVAILILVGGGWSGSLSVLFSATLRTYVNAAASILSSIFRLVIGIMLLYMGMGFVGVMGGYITASLVSDAVYLYMCRGVRLRRPSLTLAKELIEASMPSYIPSILGVAGTWLGVVGIFGLTGGEQTGTYYMAFTIASLVYTIPGTLLGLMFPVLSGMEDGRKRATNRAVRLTYALIAPVSALGIMYPGVPLGLIGEAYTASATALRILLLGTFVAPICSGFGSLIYAYGRYRLVTIMGVVGNVPRVLLYLPLVTLWGDVGAAVAYVAGYFASLVAAVVLSRRVRYKLEARVNATLAGVPMIVALAAGMLGVHWVVGTLIVAALSVLAYARLGLITREDLSEVSAAILSKKQISMIYPHTRYILSLLYGEDRTEE